ncbi:MAG: type II toxin-antitoxin system PemK/MazF family toxin [Bacteroidetes bacterium]|nr:type II toxin-antitoxin system PemK/MazF family toxin [Bacteroidota bacterium]
MLVPFPFTDLVGVKKRPSIIISPNSYNTGNDVIIGFVTSNIGISPRVGDYLMRDWTKANLLKPSLFRMKFATIDQTIIIRKLGTISDYDWLQIEDSIIDFIKN